MRLAGAFGLLVVLSTASLAVAETGRRNYPAERHEGLTPELKQRIYQAGVRHLTLDDRTLAATLARQPGLSHLTHWSASEVQRLRTVGALPTIPVRNELLADLSARFLERVPPRKSSLQAGVEKLARQQPGVTVESLTYLARYNPRLARAILKHLAAAPRPRRPAVELDATEAGALPLSRVLLTKILSRPESPLIDRLNVALEKVDSHVGIGSKELAPDLHVDQARNPELQAVMAQVYRRTGGRRTLAIKKILEALPRAAVDAAKPRTTKWGAAPARPETRKLLVDIVREAIEVLAADYEKKVIDGFMAPENFREAWAISPDDWAQLLRRLPTQFIPLSELPLDDRRLHAVAAGYKQLLAGKLNSKAFYLRTGVGADLLALLQAADPRRFPRQDGTPVYQPIAKGHDRRVMATTAAHLDEALSRETDRRSAKSVIRGAGISQAQFDRLQRKAGRVAEAPSPLNTRERARLLGDRASEIFRRRILVDVTDVVSELSGDRRFMAQIGGELSVERYQQLRALASDSYPPLKRGPENEKAVSDLLAAKIAEIKRRGGSLAIKDLVAALLPELPRLKPHRLERLRRARHELFEEERTSPAQNHARLKPQRQETAAAPRTQVRDRVRASLPVNEVARLLLELSPPGVSDADLMVKLNRWLEARGLPAYTAETVGGVMKQLYAEGSPIRKRNARVVSEILAEYKAASPGRSEEALFAQVLHDFPTLKPIELGRYRAMWQKNPEDYPALKRAPKGPRRYRGGWDVERAVLGPARKDPGLTARLARLSQFPRIPARLPVLDTLVADLEGTTPLRRHNLLMVSHLLGSTVALTDGLRAAGISVERSIIVGTPYGSNEAVRDTLRHEGFDVRVPRLSPREYYNAVKKALRELADRYRNDPRKKPILVLDDGGLVSEILHRNIEEFADVLPAFRIVEQTTRGITQAQRRALKVPVLDVPRTRSKKAEGRFIGEAVAAKVVQALRRQGTNLRRRRVVIMGNGTVGSATARAIAAAEPTAEIVFVERNKHRAASASYPVVSKESALASADVIIGTTGEESLSVDDLKQLKNGAVVVSASSKRLEFGLEKLQEVAVREELGANNPLVKLPSARYRFNGKSIIALGDGWPINFDGDVEDIAPEHIQITRAVMFAGALQVAKLDARFRKNQGLIRLDRAMDQRIMKLTRPYRRRPSTPERFDPDRWMDTVREMTTYL